MADGWIDWDECELESLPDWAQGLAAAKGAHLTSQGLVHSTGKRASVAHWRDVLGVVLVEDEAWVLVPREPPKPPWIPVAAEDVGDADVDAFARAVRGRAAQGGYRDARPIGSRLSKSELLRRILRREPLPGALEVPPSTVVLSGRWIDLARAGSVAAGVGLGMAATVAAAAALGPAVEPVLILTAGLSAGTSLGAIGANALGKAAARRQLRKDAPRVLVLAPDGCVVGFSRGVTAYAWPEVGEFSVRPSLEPPPKADRVFFFEREREPTEDLVLTDPEGEVLGRIGAGWFGAPMPLIVAVAEAYRKRATTAA